MNVRLKVNGTGGHSSIPPFDQAVDKLSKAVARLYDYPQPSMFGKGPEKDMFSYIAPKVRYFYDILHSNLTYTFHFPSSY